MAQSLQVSPPPHIARSTDKNRTASAEKVQYYLSTQQLQFPPHSVPPVPPHNVPPSYVSTEAATTTTSFAQQHLPQGPNPQDAHVSIAMMEEPPTAHSTGKPKKGHGRDDGNESESSDTDSDAPTVQHFNVSFRFKKTFREHKGANAVGCIYAKLSCLYNGALMVTYNCCLLTFGFILTVIWGILNGMTAFLQAWILSPFLRVSLIIVKGIMPLVLDPLSLLMKAYVDACRGPGGGIGAAIGGVMQGVSSGISR